MLATKRLSETSRAHAKELLKVAAVLQYTVYGIPSIFYGDEIGLEGHHDPFCRRPYPWGREDGELLAFYRSLGQIRCEQSALTDGEFALTLASDRQIAFVRGDGEERLIVVANVSDSPYAYAVEGMYIDLLTNTPYEGIVPAMRAVILKEREA